MREEDSDLDPTEWLVVPPAGVPGCPLEDWLAALAKAGEKPQAKRGPEGVWIHLENNPIAGFVSIDCGLVEAINFEIPGGAIGEHRERLRIAVLGLEWEIWDQNADDESGDVWDEEFEDDDI